MPAVPTYLLPVLALFLMAGHATAQMRQEQRVGDFLPTEGIGSTMRVDGEWAALGSTAIPQPYVGKVLMCRRQSGVWSTVQTLVSPDVESHQQFGIALGLQGDWLAVTELGENTTLRGGQSNVRGVIRLFHRQGENWALVQTLRPGSEITKDGEYQFGTSLAMHGDRLIALMDRQIIPTDGTESEVIDSTLHSYRLRGGSWQLEQVIEDNVLARPTPYGAHSLSLMGDWLAVGDYGSLSKDWQPTGAVHLFRPQNTRWKLAQTLVPPADSPAQLFGTQVALADDGHLLITTPTSIMNTRWDGKRWSLPVKVNIGSISSGIQSFAVHGKTAAVGVLGDLHLLSLTDQGWRRMRSVPVFDPYASSLALSADTLLFPSKIDPQNYRLRSISFLTLADLEVRLGRVQVQSGNPGQFTESPVIAAGGEVVWQPQLQGNEVPFTVSNVSTGLMPRPVASISGPNAASFEILPQSASPALLVPGEQITFVLRLRSGALVTDSPLTVTFSTSGAVPDYSFQLRWNLPSGPILGSPLVLLTAGDFWQLGQPVHLAPKITGIPVSALPTFRWLRDGVELPGQNGAVLSLPEVKPEHAGSYTLEVRNQGATTTSSPCQIVVFDPVEEAVYLKDGELGRVKPRFWGSAEITWLNPQNYQDLTSPYLAGVTLPTLTILDGRWIDSSGMSEMEAIASVVDPESQTQLAWKVIGRFRLISVGRKPVLIPMHNPFYAVGDSIGEAVIFPNHARDLYGGRNAWPGSRLTASGLPPGVVLQNSAVVGTFTKAGIYPVTWRLQDASGAWSDPVTSVFYIGLKSIASQAGLHVSSFTGNGTVPELAFPGILEVQMNLSGGFSGILKVPGATRRFSGKLKEVTDAPAGFYDAVIPLSALPGTRSSQMYLQVFPGQSSLTAQVTCVSNVPGLEEVINASLRHRPLGTAPISSEQVGPYNVLIDNTGALDERDAPAGTGFMRVTVSPAHTAQVVGTLADGTGITAACHVMRDESSQLVLPLFMEDNRAGNLLGGEIQIGSPERPLGAQAFMRWRKRPASNTNLYPGGFDMNLYGEGWRYIPPPAGVLLLNEAADQPGNAFCQTDFMDDGLFRLTRDHRAIPMSTRSLNKLQRMDFFAPTGFFSGQIQVADSTQALGVRLPTRSVPFRGLVVPASSYGGGFLFFPQASEEGAPASRLMDSRQVRLYTR